MRGWFALIFALLIWPVSTDARAEPFFQSVAIFEPEAKHNHSSCVVELANGDLLAAWYSGSGERSADDVVIQGAWLPAGRVLWGPRFLLADTPGYPDCNPALFAAPNQTIWLFWPTILDHHWESALLKFAATRDDGRHFGPLKWEREGVLHVTPVGFDREMARAIETLSEPTRALTKRWLDTASARSKDPLYQRLGWMPRVHPTVLPSGRWLLPLYSDTFSASIVAISDDRGASWSASAPIIGWGNIQPSLVRKENGTIVAFMRDNGPFRKIRVSSSQDDGKTWGLVESSALPNPGSGVEAIRLKNGRWAIVYNDTSKGRHSLALSISDDEGATWKWTRHVERQAEGQGQYHYPSMIQTRDGRIHVTYTHRGASQGSTIEHAVGNEEWVVAGDGASPSGG